MRTNFVCTLLVLLSFLAVAVTIDKCQNLTVAGETYTLSKDISWTQSSGGCLNISANNITLDCQGHWINGTGKTYTYGVYNNEHDGVTVKNCKIAGLDHAIYWHVSADYGVISSNTLNSNDGSGVSLDFNCTNNRINDNIVSDNGAGIVLTFNCDNNNITGNTIRNSGDSGVYLGSNSNKNTITNQQCVNNFFGIYIDAESHENNVVNNNIQGGQSGIILHSASKNNEVRGNTIADTERGISLFYESNDNQISNNRVTNSSWFDVSLDVDTSGNTGANTCQTLEDLGSNTVTCSGAGSTTPTPITGGATPTNGGGSGGSGGLCCLSALVLAIPLFSVWFLKRT